MLAYTTKSGRETGESFDKRLIAYGAMAAAVALGAPSAEAAIVFTDPVDAQTGYNGSVFFNPETGAVSTSNATGMLFQLLNNLYTSSSGSIYRGAYARPVGGANATFAGFSYPYQLNAGDLIDNGLSFSTFSSTLANSFANGYWNALVGTSNTGFLGFRFDIGGNNHFGWAEISIDDEFRVTLHSFAYEACSGEGINAGASTGGATCGSAPVPEPHSAALVALGAAGLVAWRRRRKAA